MSYYGVPRSFYHEMNAETPGWQFAPVPGWGVNPLRAGPARVGVGVEEASTSPLNSPLLWGGALLGMLLLTTMAEKKVSHRRSAA